MESIDEDSEVDIRRERSRKELWRNREYEREEASRGKLRPYWQEVESIEVNSRGGRRERPRKEAKKYDREESNRSEDSEGDSRRERSRKEAQRSSKYVTMRSNLSFSGEGSWAAFIKGVERHCRIHELKEDHKLDCLTSGFKGDALNFFE